MNNTLTFENPAIETFLYDNSIWNAKLSFYEEELNIFKCQLDKLAYKHKIEEPNELADLENSFQNHKKNFTKLKREVKEEGNEIVEKINGDDAEITTLLHKHHFELNAKFEHFENDFISLHNKIQPFMRVYAER
jgi:hypothetical protein